MIHGVWRPPSRSLLATQNPLSPTSQSWARRCRRSRPSTRIATNGRLKRCWKHALSVFSFVFGVPAAQVLDVSWQRGIITVGTATSSAEAQALEAAGVALIIATGFEAGGHRPSFLDRAEQSLIGTFMLIQLIAPRVKVPVIVAGGIADRRGLQATLKLGAQAVQVGMAFLACQESGATEEQRTLLFSERAHQTTLTRGFTGRLARGLCNRRTDEIAPRFEPLGPIPAQSWFVAQLRVAAVRAQRNDLVSLWSRQIAPNLQHCSAQSLYAALTSDDASQDAAH